MVQPGGGGGCQGKDQTDQAAARPSLYQLRGGQQSGGQEEEDPGAEPEEEDEGVEYAELTD